MREEDKAKFVGGIVGVVLAIIIGLILACLGLYIIPAMFFKFIIGMMVVSFGLTIVFNGILYLVK